jgi:hypothetical protein
LISVLFEGNYANAEVILGNNKLTEFREDVFKSMLQQMAAQPAGSGGQVVVTESNLISDSLFIMF